jgi:copper oxidase (laccase) domain-containing protein
VTTTRAGGVSAPPYDTFNLGDHVGDDPAAVAANRKSWRRVGLTTDKVVWMNQVHGGGWHASAGPLEGPTRSGGDRRIATTTPRLVWRW